mmetsp:Transcript_14385/g.41983  ORF Transcript_14385/g.41983 Transcript_14385/m.41983 type:complete len:266 (-) Transcript_14385:502-1299(-)
MLLSSKPCTTTSKKRSGSWKLRPRPLKASRNVGSCSASLKALRRTKSSSARSEMTSSTFAATRLSSISWCMMASMSPGVAPCTARSTNRLFTMFRAANVKKMTNARNMSPLPEPVLSKGVYSQFQSSPPEIAMRSDSMPSGTEENASLSVASAAASASPAEIASVTLWTKKIEKRHRKKQSSINDQKRANTQPESTSSSILSFFERRNTFNMRKVLATLNVRATRAKPDCLPESAPRLTKPTITSMKSSMFHSQCSATKKRKRCT